MSLPLLYSFFIKLINFKISLTLMYFLLNLIIIFEENVKVDISIVVNDIISISVKEVEVEEVDIKEFKDRVKIKDLNNF